MESRKDGPIAVLTPHEQLILAVQAHVDPRTVRRYLSGHPVVSTTRTAIQEALIQMGLSELVRHDERQRRARVVLRETLARAGDG